MKSRLLLLCPGQGGQHAGMYDLARTHAGARDFLARCALADDAEARFDNAVAQPAIVAASLAMWIALQDRIPAPALVAGYSIGELSAYAVAGALGPDETVRLAAQRAALMDAAASGVPQGLAAASGVAVSAVAALADVAIVTGHDTCIVGGTRAQLDALPARLADARIQPLPVAVASHTALMQPAVPGFRQALEASAWTAPRCPVLAGIDGTRVTTREVALDRLARQLSETIVWAACMDAAAEAGVTVALELGPGAALTRMLQTRHPGIDCRSVADFRSLDGIAAWLARHAD